MMSKYDNPKSCSSILLTCNTYPNVNQNSTSSKVINDLIIFHNVMLIHFMKPSRKLSSLQCKNRHFHWLFFIIFFDLIESCYARLRPFRDVTFFFNQVTEFDSHTSHTFRKAYIHQGFLNKTENRIVDFLHKLAYLGTL